MSKNMKKKIVFPPINNIHNSVDWNQFRCVYPKQINSFGIGKQRQYTHSIFVVVFDYFIFFFNENQIQNLQYSLNCFYEIDNSIIDSEFINGVCFNRFVNKYQ